jgi:hypothetical protein
MRKCCVRLQVESLLLVVSSFSDPSTDFHADSMFVLMKFSCSLI